MGNPGREFSRHPLLHGARAALHFLGNRREQARQPHINAIACRLVVAATGRTGPPASAEADTFAGRVAETAVATNAPRAPFRAGVHNCGPMAFAPRSNNGWLKLSRFRNKST